ncbi:hypothetical protein KUV50_05300 [Membranicola marinus]|uniref:Uncharacterized protein n=1 Tax=Membranihabitans marinus TaxID=1227546 RepID=A0A953HVZ3_9BACT|nr:hypothetical protein [Membranihabitans marinus]MBY5957541.1 hypothetical protein [Membranihabitans marinus]
MTWCFYLWAVPDRTEVVEEPTPDVWQALWSDLVGGAAGIAWINICENMSNLREFSGRIHA